MSGFVEIAVLLLGCVAQLGFTGWATASYFSVLRKTKLRSGLRYRTGEYLMFIAYVAAVIPLGVFFPMWFAERTGGLAKTLDARLFLLAFGVIGLAASAAYGWSRGRLPSDSE